jgi:hypothetical protein
MRAGARLFAVSAVRLREGLRGPVPAFLVVYLAVVAAAAFAVPGEAGPDHQRAVDAFALDAALLVAVLAAAVLCATSLAADRDAGREPWLRATALRDLEVLAGGLLGHAAALAILLAGIGLAFLAATGVIAGGYRAPTRIAIRAQELFDAADRPAPRGVVLTRDAPEATWVLPAVRGELEPGRPCRAFAMLTEYAEDMNSLPELYPVAIRVGDGPERILRHRTGNPLEVEFLPGDLRPEGTTRVAVRRLDPAYALGLFPGGLVVQGRERSFPLNSGKALLAWFLALLPLGAAGVALSTFLGAPVGIAGALLFALLSRSVGWIAEMASHAFESTNEAARLAARVLVNAASLLPDLARFDLSVPVVTRWDIPGRSLLALAPPALAWAAVFLVLGLAARAAGRRR